MALISPLPAPPPHAFLGTGVEAAGVSAYTVYNQHAAADGFSARSREDYHHLKHAVQLWDVACEAAGGDPGARRRAAGADADPPADLRGMLPGQCYYVPMVDETGGHAERPGGGETGRGSLVDIHCRQ